jgi:hypothetical protein
MPNGACDQNKLFDYKINTEAFKPGYCDTITTPTEPLSRISHRRPLRPGFHKPGPRRDGGPRRLRQCVLAA